MDVTADRDRRDATPSGQWAHTNSAAHLELQDGSQPFINGAL